MNKTLRLLLLTGLAAFLCASCNKVEEIFPESYHRNDNPFSVEKVPAEGGTIMLQRVNGGQITILDPESASFRKGDTLILTATPTNGYTFINWKRDGVEKTTEPSYKFCLEEKDVDGNGHVKYHYEARFGLDYSIQSIPSIDKIIPPELIAIMGPHLHFGDNPPLLYKMSVDSILGFYAKNPTLLDYYAVDSTAEFCRSYFVVDPITGQNTLPTEKSNWDFFLFHDQHRGIAQFDYKCLYVDTTYHINNLDINLRLWDLTHSNDSVFIMGNGENFTAYFNQYRIEREYYCTPNPYITIPQPTNPGSHEAVILSGKITDNSVKDLYFGIQFKSYDDPNNAGIAYANIGDIIVYHYDSIPFSYWNPNN